MENIKVKTVPKKPKDIEKLIIIINIKDWTL